MTTVGAVRHSSSIPSAATPNVTMPATDAADGHRSLVAKPNLSRPAPGHEIYPYLLRDVVLSRPNQVWSTDITYIPMRAFVNLIWPHFDHYIWPHPKADMDFSPYIWFLEGRAGV
jgi:hypothetical protein